MKLLFGALIGASLLFAQTGQSQAQPSSQPVPTVKTTDQKDGTRLVERTFANGTKETTRLRRLGTGYVTASFTRTNVDGTVESWAYSANGQSVVRYTKLDKNGKVLRDVQITPRPVNC